MVLSGQKLKDNKYLLGKIILGVKRIGERGWKPDFCHLGTNKNILQIFNVS